MLLKQKEEASGIYTEEPVPHKSLRVVFSIVYPNTDIFYQKKQRRKHSLNRNFHSDYIGIDHK